MKLTLIIIALLFAIAFLLVIIYAVKNSEEAIEDEDGNIIGYKPNNKR